MKNQLGQSRPLAWAMARWSAPAVILAAIIWLAGGGLSAVAQTERQQAEAPASDAPEQEVEEDPAPEAEPSEQPARARQPDPAERARALREAGTTEDRRGVRRVPASRPPGSRDARPTSDGEPAVAEGASQDPSPQQGQTDAAAGTAGDVQPEMGQGVEEQSAQPRLNPRERARALRQSGAVNRRMPARGASARGVSPARVQEEMTGATDQDTTARIEMMREHLDQYYENQRLISKEWTDWQLTEQMLTARVNHMKQQIEAVREDTAKLEGEITDADREKNELAEKNQRLGELREYQRRQVERLERKARTLAGYLPPSLAAKLNPLIERLPPADADPEEIEISVAQRYPTVLAIFNQVEEFNRAIQLEMDTYELETGDEVQVEVLYLGLGQGYMVQVGQEEGGLAGVGNPSAEGWVWERRDDLADEIRKVIRIYEGEGTAEFVGLPATIK